MPALPHRHPNSPSPRAIRNSKTLHYPAISPNCSHYLQVLHRLPHQPLHWRVKPDPTLHTRGSGVHKQVCRRRWSILPLLDSRCHPRTSVRLKDLPGDQLQRTVSQCVCVSQGLSIHEAIRIISGYLYIFHACTLQWSFSPYVFEPRSTPTCIRLK